VIGNLLPDWLDQRARTSPERPAVRFEGAVWSYRELDRRVALAARRLSETGLASGSRVAVLADNSAALVAAVHAVPRADGVLVPLNTRLTAAELAAQLGDCDATLLITDERNRAPAAAAAQRAGLPPPLDLAALLAPGDPAPATNLRWVAADAPHTIIYTSGTTGKPKGAVLTYGNHTWSAIGSTLNLGLHPNDRWLACLPLFHVGGLSILVRAALSGLEVEVLRGFDPAAVNEAIDRGASLVSLVAVMLERLLDDRGGRSYPPTLRCVLLGGGPAPADLLRRAVEAKVPIAQTYGLTEAASQVTTLAPQETAARLGSSGKPLFPTEVRVVGPDGASLPPGAEGEIVIRGLTVSPRYFGRTDERPDGWLRTGDIGFLDADGYLTVLDRRDDLIISGGENVYPAEIEAVLREHPEVVDVGVVGAPDPTWGQRVVAFVVIRGENAPDLEDFCRARLAGYKIPRRFIRVAALPRNAAGKLLRGELRRRFQQGG
jgi:O-succinylbenzoic acid--CoA ligase